MVVDFPAPFGPRNPVTTPGFTTKLSPSTAALSPYRLVRPSISIICVLFSSLVADEMDATHRAARGHLPWDRTFRATYARRHRPRSRPLHHAADQCNSLRTRSVTSVTTFMIGRTGAAASARAASAWRIWRGGDRM